MPELPDINAYLFALDQRIVGRTVASVRVASAFVLRTAHYPACWEPIDRGRWMNSRHSRGK
jgi:formamidopyrimidine-DNA glycosylase